MQLYEVTKETRDEWSFGKRLERILKDMGKRNPEAKVILAKLQVDKTVWVWIYKDGQVS